MGNPDYARIAAVLRGSVPVTAELSTMSWVTDNIGAFDSLVDRVIPRSHRRLDLATVHPHPDIVIADAVQSQMITMLRETHNLRGLVILGPPGAGKTALVCAWLKDQITWRLLDDKVCNRPLSANAYRVLARHLHDDHKHWESRDYANKSVSPPSLTSTLISRTTDVSGWPPILWIDEFDNLPGTDFARNLIDDLANTVYEAQGALIVTSNYTMPQFEAALSAKTLRRLLGTNEADKSKYLTYNLHKAPRR